MSRMRLFAHTGQPVYVVEPLQMKDFQATPPFSVFMRSDVWINAGQALTDRYPQDSGEEDHSERDARGRGRPEVRSGF